MEGIVLQGHCIDKLYSMDPDGAGYELVKDKKPCRDDNAVLL